MFHLPEAKEQIWQNENNHLATTKQWPDIEQLKKYQMEGRNLEFTDLLMAIL